MAEKQDTDEFMSYEEALLSQVFTLDALVNVLENKGLVTRQEIIEEIKRLQAKAAASE